MNKIRMTKDWQKRFAERINTEFHNYRKEADSEMNRAIKIGIKDCLYLLGEAIDKKQYIYAGGFEKFCIDIGIDYKLIQQI